MCSHHHACRLAEGAQFKKGKFLPLRDYDREYLGTARDRLLKKSQEEREKSKKRNSKVAAKQDLIEISD